MKKTSLKKKMTLFAGALALCFQAFSAPADVKAAQKVTASDAWVISITGTNVSSSDPGIKYGIASARDYAANKNNLLQLRSATSSSASMATSFTTYWWSCLASTGTSASPKSAADNKNRDGITTAYIRAFKPGDVLHETVTIRNDSAYELQNLRLLFSVGYDSYLTEDQFNQLWTQENPDSSQINYFPYYGGDPASVPEGNDPNIRNVLDPANWSADSDFPNAYPNNNPDHPDWMADWASSTVFNIWYEDASNSNQRVDIQPIERLASGPRAKINTEDSPLKTAYAVVRDYDINSADDGVIYMLPKSIPAGGKLVLHFDSDFNTYAYYLNDWYQGMLHDWGFALTGSLAIRTTTPIDPGGKGGGGDGGGDDGNNPSYVEPKTTARTPDTVTVPPVVTFAPDPTPVAPVYPETELPSTPTPPVITIDPGDVSGAGKVNPKTYNTQEVAYPLIAIVIAAAFLVLRYFHKKFNKSN